jgi:formiminotetrahydrofolate cyclodeaminase
MKTYNYENLLKNPTDGFLEMFGLGKETPGSGSAAAFIGLISGQLLKTVVTLTNNDKNKKNYQELLPELLRLASDIKTRILPRLNQLLQRDSDEFKVLIKLRTARDEEFDMIKKRIIELQIRKLNVDLIEIPIEIATLCLELADYAITVFKSGFKSARGDSNVAFNGAISATSGCLAIISLNLQSSNDHKLNDKVRSKVRELNLRLIQLNNFAYEMCELLLSESEAKDAYNIAIEEIRSSFRVNISMSDTEIEELAKKLQNTLWTYRGIMWKHNTPQTPVELLEPEAVLRKVLNFRVSYPESLGFNEVKGDIFMVAGLIDKNRMEVKLSKHFSSQTIRFTAAHELGHALLHKQMVLHRDRAMDGSSSIYRSKQEKQADKFATFFLMPGKIVKNVFIELFATEKLVVNQNTVFGLTNTAKVGEFRKRINDVDKFAYYIAGVETYGGRKFKSLADIFQVSIKTMAIRLVELGLVEL